MKFQHLRNALLALVVAVVAACGGGMNDSVQPMSTTGTALVTLTDAPGDFVSYIVNVTSIQLKRADGTMVETLPATTQVDFAQLVNLSEVISASNVPVGNYVAAALTLDYNGASIVVDNGSGSVTVPAGNIINGATGNPLTSPASQVTLSLQLPASRPLVITPRTLANLALDFNLAASNTVAPAALTATTPASTVTVTVNPVLAASIAPDATKQLRLRGLLAGVTNTATATSYAIQLRPFYNGGGTHGDLVVLTTSTTSFLINGTSYTGTAGLAALAALPVGTLTAADGTFDVAARSYTAASVVAGTSIAGAGLDSIEGTVIARSGNVLTLGNGLICLRNRGGVQFGRQVAVTVGAATTVSRAGLATAASVQDISVGQHVQIFGTASTDTAGVVSMNASAGSARLLVTGLWGQYSSTLGGVVTVSLQQLDGRPASAFNFAGTGATIAQDAVASAYTVGLPASLPLGSISAGTPIRFYGFPSAFGAAPPAFTASSLVNYAATSARLGIAWLRPGVTAPFVTPLGAANVAITQGTLQSAALHALQIGPQRVDLSAATTGLRLVPNAAAAATGYAIAHRMSRRIDSYSTFADAITALNTALNGTTAVLELAADGPYDASTGTLSVNHLIVVLGD